MNIFFADTSMIFLGLYIINDSLVQMSPKELNTTNDEIGKKIKNMWNSGSVSAITK